MGICGWYKKGVSKTTPYVSWPRDPLQKPSPIWAEQDSELPHCGHIWAYVGAQRVIIINHTLCRRGKIGD